jgi:hypothetical protein
MVGEQAGSRRGNSNRRSSDMSDGAEFGGVLFGAAGGGGGGGAMQRRQMEMRRRSEPASGWQAASQGMQIPRGGEAAGPGQVCASSFSRSFSPNPSFPTRAHTLCAHVSLF